MKKKFNDTGLCVADKHFMVDTATKISKIMSFIEQGEYFTINRPRQFGKTTTAHLIAERIKKNSTYLLLDLSLEGKGETIYESIENFCNLLLTIFHRRLLFLKENELALFCQDNKNKIQNLDGFSLFISELIEKASRKVVLMIDEVDKSSNHLLFLNFLGLLRDKYLLQSRGEDFTFQSVILVGVHDIKNLKSKFRPDEQRQWNSPWNIAADFTVDLSFSAKEIESMLLDYVQTTQNQMDIPMIAEKLYFYTSGYPYLVSKMCKIIDEIIIIERVNKNWTLEDLEESFKYLVNPAYQTTLFDDLIKNLNNNPDLYQLVFDIVINGNKRSFNIGNPIISIAHTYGILSNELGFCKVHNRVFEKKIYDLMLSIQENKEPQPSLNRSLFEGDNELLLEKALLAFQAFMQENYSERDVDFLEREGRLLFMSFLKPILNGKGFDFKEPVVGDERRIDIAITYLDKRYVVELKRWQGESYHEKGLEQLSAYLDTYQLKEGFLLIFDFRKTKEYKSQWIDFQDKRIFALWV